MDLLDIFKETGIILKKHLVWIGRALAILGFLNIVLHYFKINLWEFLKIETPELIISVSLLFFWFSIETINKIPESIGKLLKAEYKLKNPKFEEVKKEIKEKFNKSKKIMIFSYTGETLDNLNYDFVNERKDELEVQLLCRNWKLEKKDQEKYNNSNSEVVGGKKKPWDKADMIATQAIKLQRLCAKTNVKLDQRFYENLPFYHGYIFDNLEAYIAEYEWQKDPKEGGSQYKGNGRPFTYYSNETELGKEKIKVLTSRFELLWEVGKSYDQV